ncbi:MAG: PorP/SprF family type IX secretion system membrane protein [Sphingobacteriaceae bacterium]
MKHTTKLLLTLLLAGFTGAVNAQINPFDAQLFQNQYLANPAKAGAEEGARLNLGYKNQWSSMPGAPRNSIVSYDTRSNKNGLGLSVFNDKAGLINYTKILGTYAYHLPLSGTNEFIHLGVSLGIFRGTLSMDELVADPNDPNLVSFNDRQMVFDGDVGIAYSSEKFGVEAVLYNLISQIKNDSYNKVDNHTTYFAVDYAFPVSDWSFKSKIAYRGVRNYTDIVDFAVNGQTPDEKLDFTVAYHTNKSASFGIGYWHRKQWQVLGVYNTSPKPINAYVNGTFEVGLKVNLYKK